MQQYIYEDQYKGQPRKLLIVSSADQTGYRVFCEGAFLGAIQLLQDNDTISWKTEYNILKPIAAKIGAHITSCQLAALDQD